MVFHVDVYMPDQVYIEAAFCLCELGGRFVLTRHAEIRKEQKGIRIPERIPVGSYTIVEVTGIPLQKMLVRFPFEGKDIVMALTKEGRVTTLYVNERDDVHKTLDPSKYEARPCSS